jgi:hypothetical protein
MNNIDISSYISDDTNLVEIYFCLYKYNHENTININLKLSDDIVEKFKEKYKNTKLMKYKSYYINDKFYMYDLSNDYQSVNSRVLLKKAHIIRRKKATDLFINAYKHEKFPSHLFPCTDNIDYISEVDIYECRLTNRVSINLKYDDGVPIIYIEYKHSPNVEIDRVNEMINRLVYSL